MGNTVAGVAKKMGRNEHLILKTNFRGPWDEATFDKVIVATGMYVNL